MIYTVQHRYRSALGGPWDAGREMEMSEEMAATFNADSPGVLKPKKVDKKADKPAVSKPPNDRQVKTASKRAPTGK